MQLEGKVAVITGAGSGIGLATTQLFVEEGAQVIAADVSEKGLARLTGIRGVETVVADVTNEADVDRLIATAERYGHLDVLFNNAGIVDRLLPVAECTDDVWQRVLAVNLYGPFYTCRRALPGMLQRGHGVIINTASVAGLAGARAGVAYTVSKHGLIGLTRNIAATYGSQGIRCVAIAPGGVNTGISLGGEPSQIGLATLTKAMSTNVRTGEPIEIARVALFAASDAASFVNGAVLVADGGWLAV